MSTYGFYVPAAESVALMTEDLRLIGGPIICAEDQREAVFVNMLRIAGYLIPVGIHEGSPVYELTKKRAGELWYEIKGFEFRTLFRLFDIEKNPGQITGWDIFNPVDETEHSLFYGVIEPALISVYGTKEIMYILECPCEDIESFLREVRNNLISNI